MRKQRRPLPENGALSSGVRRLIVQRAHLAQAMEFGRSTIFLKELAYKDQRV
jgi:hypothetical protein